MRHTNKIRRFVIPAAGWSLVLAVAASAQDRGTLVVTTYPDSATVVLDDSKDAERQHTPFTNESMIPGSHTVILRPADPAYKSVRLDVSIEAGQTATLEHTFEYRTMAYGMEMLSVAPWKFEVATGFEALRYIGLEAEKADPKAPAIPKSYPTDSIPNSLHFPVNFRLGFPGGWELHFA
ncbi:MAG: PEGA domain-containing protein, partial [Fibrobacterota bacterium]